ncbi:MAG: S8 family serine peptidase [Acidimicrobiia bacterium]
MLKVRPGLSAMLAFLLGITGSVLLPANDVLALPSYGPDTPDAFESVSSSLIVIAEESVAGVEGVLDEQQRLVDDEALFEPDEQLLDAIDELAGEEIPVTLEGVVDVEAVMDDAGIDFDQAEPIAGDVWVVETDADPAEIEDLPGVAAVEEDFVVAPSTEDPYLTQQWGLHNFGQTVAGTPGIATADIGWRAAQTRVDGSGVVVAVVDSGIELTHLDLANSIWVNTGEVCGNGIDDDGNGYIDDCNGFDLINRDGTPFDQRTAGGAPVDNNHGTHVAGIIAAATSNGTGVAGVASGARIMSVKVFENGSTTISTIIQGIDYASSNGADIINLSLGSSPGSPYSQALYDAVARAEQRGSLVVAAAGNSGVDIDRSPVWPASLSNPNVITVGASTNRDARASFSNFGLVGVDVFAPGQSIVSSVGGGGYAFYNGTSMAAPMVSGVAALIAQASGSDDPLEIRRLLLAGVVPVPAFSGVSTTGGRASAGAAMGFAALEDGSVAFTADGLGGFIEGPVQAVLTVGSPRAVELSTNLDLTLGAVVDGSVSAVIGHPVAVGVDGAGGPRSTSNEGQIDLGLTDSQRQSLAIGTLQLNVSTDLPDGDYVLYLGGTTGGGTVLIGQMVRFRAGTEPTSPPSSPAVPSAPSPGTPPPAAGGGGTGGGTGGGGSPVAPPPGSGVSPVPGGGGSSTPPPSSGDGGPVGGGGQTPPPGGGGGGSSTGGDGGPVGGGGQTPAPGGSTGGGSTGGGSGSGSSGGGTGGGGSTGGESTPPPSASSVVSPTSGPTSGGTLVRINAAFSGVRSVSFGGSPSSFVFATTNFVLAESPRRVAGTVDIVVSHAGGDMVYPGAFTFQGEEGSGGGGQTPTPDNSTGGGSTGGGSTGGGSTPPPSAGGSTGGGSSGGGSAPGSGGGSATPYPGSQPAPTPPTTAPGVPTTQPPSGPAPVVAGQPRTLDNGLTVDAFGSGHPLGAGLRGGACGGDDCRSFRP